MVNLKIFLRYSDVLNFNNLKPYGISNFTASTASDAVTHTLSLEESISRANDRCNIGVNKIRKLFEETPKSLKLIQDTVDAIMELSGKGYSLYVLSNMHKHSFEYLSKTYDIWRYFSGIVISSHIKSIKPEPEIFEYLIGTYNLIPRNTVFLDDLRCNIDAAKKFGLNTIHVKNASKIKDELYQMIGI